jgi:hypothetical protein
MIKESIIDLITAIAEGDTIGIEDSFNTVMSYKIADRLDSMRVDTAQGMFGSVVEESVELDEEFALEDYSLEELEDFMLSEDFEQLDELSKATLGSYVKKASDSGVHNARSAGVELGVGASKRKEKYNDYEDIAAKRLKGISKAVDKLTKEEFELEEAVTASQLIANHNSSDHGGAQHFSNVDGKHHSWNYVKKNKEGTKYEVTPDKGEAEGIAHKGKFLKLKK